MLCWKPKPLVRVETPLVAIAHLAISENDVSCPHMVCDHTHEASSGPELQHPGSLQPHGIRVAPSGQAALL
jgi:hypothetical protein